MFSRARLVIVTALAALVLVGLAVPAVEAKAKPVPKVSGLAAAGQDWYNGKLKVKWKKVTGARYQVRWGTSAATLRKAKIYATAATSATSPALNRCVTNYAQVRAVKRGKAGAWSTAKGMKLTLKKPAGAGVLASQFKGTGLPNGVKFSWNAVPNATRYRVRWSAAPPGAPWPGRPNGYVTPAPLVQSARSASLTFTAPHSGDQMMGVAYGNPVFAEMDASTECSPALPAPPRTGFKTAYFPTPVTPGPGEPLRFGTYNVENQPTEASAAARLANLADNIVQRDLDVLALQEASFTTAVDLSAKLNLLESGTDWVPVAAGTGADNQIIYRSSKYTITDPPNDSGRFGTAAPANPGILGWTTWARLAPVSPAPGEQGIFVVSLHLSEGPGGTLARANREFVHSAALELLGDIDATNHAPAPVLPVLVAGDFKGNFQTYCDELTVPACAPEGQPTFIRAGYYDSMATADKVGSAYTTVNGHTVPQVPSPTGFMPRADFIVLKGFKGSKRYVNVGNKDYGGVTPSDHNLVYADLTVPYLP